MSKAIFSFYLSQCRTTNIGSDSTVFHNVYQQTLYLRQMYFALYTCKHCFDKKGKTSTLLLVYFYLLDFRPTPITN